MIEMIVLGIAAVVLAHQYGSIGMFKQDHRKNHLEPGIESRIQEKPGIVEMLTDKEREDLTGMRFVSYERLVDLARKVDRLYETNKIDQ